MNRRLFGFAANRVIEEPAVNLTPLIDVVFVILIAFIVLAPLFELERVELADAAIASHDPSLSVQEASPVAIHVRENNGIIINGQPVAQDQLALVLKKLKAQHPQARPQLFHDKKAHFGTYQIVKNAAESAGFKQMDIILKPSDGK